MKRNHKLGKRVLIILIALVLLVSTCVSAFASDAKECTISVNFSLEGQKIEGANFKVYKVAGFETDGTIKVEAPFENYPISWDIETAEQLKELCETLEGYIARDNVMPTAEGTTNREGKAEIQVQDRGIYMISGSLYRTDEATYKISPAMVKVIEGDTYKEVQPKYEKETQPTEDITITKVWTSHKDQLFRPTKIEAELYKDGELYATVELSEENGWKYTWPEMSTDCTWTVVEKTVLAEYFVRVSKEEKVFFIYNDFYGTPLDEDFPPPPTPDIPYTGTFWWPVPVMAIGGILLLLTGVLLKKER